MKTKLTHRLWAKIVALILLYVIFCALRRKKLRDGDVVSFQGESFTVRSDA